MNKKSTKTKLVSLAVLALTSSTLLFSGCGNMDVWDMNYTLKYAVLEENDQDVLHQVESWSDSESDSVMVRTACCGNYVWTSVNSATLYENEPDEQAYDRVCSCYEK